MKQKSILFEFDKIYMDFGNETRNIVNAPQPEYIFHNLIILKRDFRTPISEFWSRNQFELCQIVFIRF